MIVHFVSCICCCKQTLEAVDVCHICSAHSSLTFVALCYPLLQLWRFARILICARPAAQLRGYFFCPHRLLSWMCSSDWGSCDHYMCMRSIVSCCGDYLCWNFFCQVLLLRVHHRRVLRQVQPMDACFLQRRCLRSTHIPILL